MKEKDVVESSAPILWRMEDVLKHLVRNVESIQKQYPTHTSEVPYSFSCQLLMAFVADRMDKELPESLFFEALFKKASSKYSEINLFAKMNHPKFPHIQHLPMVATSNKNNMPLNTMQEIQAYASTEEQISVAVMNDGIGAELTVEDVFSNASIFLQIKPEYVQYLLEHDEEQIREALNKYEEELRKELKETGGLACNKPRLKLS
ncbi:hypothetical protein JMA_43620 (plasmid) [Jeotgalibacillus malaysiensis]|uniref:Uncharacterized protein n=1 Tax=Jeotgalibacillus malaysiensis TaxID=1508404 RepID=A0A0B5B0I6_9BACL|nr:hypothetical protein [Jeotgalibacillus malaysiensis]AJD93679.1 hypothetical protein JMA_43620 [Jeotgalibacillus malaysiensis]